MKYEDQENSRSYDVQAGLEIIAGIDGANKQR